MPSCKAVRTLSPSMFARKSCACAPFRDNSDMLGSCALPSARLSAGSVNPALNPAYAVLYWHSDSLDSTET